MILKEAEKYLSNRRVLITGHTGFTGTWAQIYPEDRGTNYAVRNAFILAKALLQNTYDEHPEFDE